MIKISIQLIPELSTKLLFTSLVFTIDELSKMLIAKCFVH